MFNTPDEETLQPAQFEYMQNYIDSLEKLLTARDFVQTRAYASMIADTTFIDWWFVMELTVNFEPMNPPYSCYFYKDRMDVLKAGPVWDFDWTTFRDKYREGFYAGMGLYYPQLFQDPVFVKKVRERWLKFKPFFDEIPDIITAEGTRLFDSAALDDEMWNLKNFENLNEDNQLAYVDAVAKMRAFFIARMNWLHTQILYMQ
jgi:hypothetical protein